MVDTSAPVTVWFDSQCPLCIKEIALMRRLDWRKNRVNFIDIHALAQSYQCPLDVSPEFACTTARALSRPRGRSAHR